MTEQAKTELSCGEYSRVVSWYPLRKWWQSSQLFGQDVGLLPLLGPWEPLWLDMDGHQKSLEACSWQGYIPTPLSGPYISLSKSYPSQKINKEQYRWRVSLDVAHFLPSEISLRVTDGFLEVRGKHEERPDEHGFIERCFTRKYRLPAETDATKMISTLSAFGILTVEALVPETSVPAATIIPIKVETEVRGENQKEEEDEESPLEVHGDQGHPGTTTTGIQKHEERNEQEKETDEKPVEKSHPSVAADGKGIESLQDSFKHPENLESRECQNKDTPEQLEQEEPVLDADIRVMAGSLEAAEEITLPQESQLGKNPQSEVPSQQLRDPDIKQEYAE